MNLYPAIIPITEECPKGHCTNPYGQTKLMLEEVLMDVQKADKDWNVVLLFCNVEIRTVAKSLPLLRLETHNSLIFSYPAVFSVIFKKNIRLAMQSIASLIT